MGLRVDGLLPKIIFRISSEGTKRKLESIWETLHLLNQTQKSTVNYGGDKEMNYWNRVSGEVREIVAARPTADHYDNSGLLARWVQNLGETGRGVICSAEGISSAYYCEGN
jgi:hypothetical protein